MDHGLRSTHLICGYGPRESLINLGSRLTWSITLVLSLSRSQDLSF